VHFILVLCLGCVVIFLTVQFYFANNFSDNFSSELHNNFTSVSVFFINSITCNFILLLTVFCGTAGPLGSVPGMWNHLQGDQVN